MFIKESYLRNDVVAPIKSAPISCATINESYSVYATRFITECTIEFTDEKQRFIRKIHEAGGSSTLLQEACSDLFNGIKTIIGKFLKFIAHIFEKFVISMNKLFKNDKFIKKHKNAFKHFEADDTFEMDLYKFTFSDTIPVISTADIVRWSTGTAGGYDMQGATGLSSLSKDTSADDFIIGLQNRRDIIKDLSTGEGLDNTRGRVIGKTMGISASDWNTELFKVYRNDDNSTTRTDVDSTIVTEALDRFLNFDKNFDAVVKKKKEIEKEYDKLKKSVKQMYDTAGWESLLGNVNSGEYSVNYDALKDLQNDTDKKKKLDVLATEFINSIRNEIQNMCNIHASAFAAKLDAEKDCLKQDRTILYKALAKIEKHTSIKEGFEPYEEIPQSPIDADGIDDEYDEERDTFVHRYSRHYPGVDDSEVAGKDTICERDIVEYMQAVQFAKECFYEMKQFTYFQEAICMENGQTDSIQLLNESVIDGFKSAISKIIDTILGFFRKINAQISGVCMNRANFLKKYKYIFDSPSKYPIQDAQITMYQYDRKKIETGFSIPSFDYPNGNFAKFMEGKGEGTDTKAFTESFIKTFLSTDGVTYDADKTLEMMIEEVLHGGDNEVTMPSKDLNYQDMYNFVLNSKSTIDHINEMETQITSNKTNLDTILKKLETEIEKDKKTAESKKNSGNTENGDTSQDNNNNNSTQTTNTAKIDNDPEVVKAKGELKAAKDNVDSLKKNKADQKAIDAANAKVKDAEDKLKNAEAKAKSKVSESFIGSGDYPYSYLYEAYLNEFDISSSGESSGNSTISKMTEPGKQGINTDNTDSGTTSILRNSLNGKNGDDYEAKLKELKELQEATTAFFDLCGQVVAAKLTVVTTMWKEYYSILKTHVMHYAKEGENK